MTSTEIAKKAFAEVTKEAEEKQVSEVKKIVQETLKKLEVVKGKIKELHEEKKILELDIDDLKEGKIDRIVERQEKDPKAKEVSVVIIIKEKETIRENNHYNPWYVPYHTFWQTEYTSPTRFDNVFCSTSIPVVDGASLNLSSVKNAEGWGTINCSVAKSAAAGAYDVGGHIVNLR
jgi:hypothetical protein